jgi:transcriptional regulator with XRE-family HTH domain
MSSSLSIDARRRTYVRLIGAIRHALNQALTEEHTARGLTQADIARLLGKDKSFVSRKLAGTSNMTLETLADLAFAMDRPAYVLLPARAAAKGLNSVRMDIAKSETSPPIRQGENTFSGMAA